MIERVLSMIHRYRRCLSSSKTTSTRWSIRSYVIDSSVSRFIISSLTYSVLIIFAFCLLRRKCRLRTSCRFLQWPDRDDNNTTPKSLSLLISMFRVQELCCICILHQGNMFPQVVELIWIKWFCRLWRTFIYLINDEVHFDTVSLWYARTCVWSTLLNNWFLLYHFLKREFYAFCFKGHALATTRTNLWSIFLRVIVISTL